MSQGTTKSILYTEGPPRITCGAAGTFERGKAKPVAADIAARLLAKSSVKFILAPEAKPASRKKEA